MKRISLIAVLFFSIIFAKESLASGWQFGASIPIGASFGFYKVRFASDAPQSYKDTYTKRDTRTGFDSGITVQGGYLVSDGEKGISLLLDFGYSHDTFAIKGAGTKESYTFESMQVGILPKFHKGNYSVGFGIGVKVPFELVHEAEDSQNVITRSKYSVDKMDSIFKDSLITYIKLSFDYSFSISERIAVLLGAYVGVDFNLDLRGSERIYVENRNLSSFDVGVQLGLRIGEGLNL